MNKIKLELDEARDTILVELLETKDNEKPVVQRFRISEDTFRNLFTGRYTTGFFFISGDGPIYIEEREGAKLVVVQRALRPDQTIRWLDHTGTHDVHVTTPWTYMVFLLRPTAGGYLREKEAIFVGSGPSLGEQTPLFNASFLGNVYSTNPPYNGTNICWGNTGIAPGGVVSLGSLTNIINDFYTQTFTNHLERTHERWDSFTMSGRVPTAAVGTLRHVIASMWGNVQ